MAHAHISEQGKLWIDRADGRIQGTLSKNYPQKHGHFNRCQGFLGQSITNEQLFSLKATEKQR